MWNPRSCNSGYYIESSKFIGFFYKTLFDNLSDRWVRQRNPIVAVYGRFYSGCPGKGTLGLNLIAFICSNLSAISPASDIGVGVFLLD
ncbi:MAG: hypothetical protein R2784_11970 [Saprospiraceae bacterium]